MQDKADNITRTVDVVSAFVSNNTVAVGDLSALIRGAYAAFSGIGSPSAAEPEEITRAKPSQIRKSITHDALISFEDGRPYKTLKRHLTIRGMTVAEYKTKWGLPNDYPTTAPGYSAARSALAKSLGLGQGVRGETRARPKKA